MVEHGVIISNVIANGGCPCPGIGDAALGVSDTILHLFYNRVAYAGVALALVFVLRDRGDISRWRGRRVPARFARHEKRRNPTRTIKFACLADRHAPPQAHARLFVNCNTMRPLVAIPGPDP